MKAHRRKRLLAILASVTGVAIAVGLILTALEQNINLFYTPKQVDAGEAPVGKTIKVGGMVVPGSVQREEDSLEVSFVVSDNAAQVKIEFADILPDLFKEGTGIVATGMIDAQGIFQASSVLAKHDENYMPPEVARALKESGHPTTPATQQP